MMAKCGQKLAKFFGEETPLDVLSRQSPYSSDFLDPDLLSDLLHYQLYHEEFKIYENTSSYGFVLEIPPLLTGGLDVQQEISSILKEVGIEGASFQCLMWADHRIAPFFDTWSKPRLERGGIFEKVAARKKDFFNSQALTSTPSRIFRSFISYSEPFQAGLQKDEHLSSLSEKKQKIIATFSRVAQAIDLSPSMLLSAVSGLINFDMDPSVKSRKKWNQETLLSKQTTLPGGAVEVRKDGLIFDQGSMSVCFKSFESVDCPDNWSLHQMGNLIGDFFNRSYTLPCPFFLHCGAFFPIQSKSELKLKTRAKMVDHQSKFPALLRLLPHLPRERAENDYVAQQLDEGEKFVETRLTCGLWASRDSLLNAESCLKSLFQKHGFKIEENAYLHLPEFLSSLPMAWGEQHLKSRDFKSMRAMRTTLTSEIASFLPLIGEWWGNSSQGMVLTGRRGQLAAWDPFEGEGNLNAVVIGPSGSGKSVFMQDLIMNSLGAGTRVFVLDLGRSFEKLCHLVNGEYLAFSEGCQLNLNPFNLIKNTGDVDAINMALEMVSSIISTMAMPSQKIDKERSDVLSSLVKKVWELKGPDASVDDIIKLLDNVSFQSELMKGVTESLKEGLGKFSRNGSYAGYFYGSNSVDFSSDLVVIETEELKNLADLQAVILQIFTLTISNQIFMGNREQRCLICIDEAWDLLKSPQMEGFIESLARRLRKYNGSLLVGTQGLKDFERSPGARAAFQNSNWLLMLGKDNDSINILKKENLIPMDVYKERVLSSLRKEDGKYSEVFIYHKGSGFHTVNQLKLDPFSSMLYSTKADEFQAVQELKSKGIKPEDAISWMVDHSKEFKILRSQGCRVKDIIHQLLKSKEVL